MFFTLYFVNYYQKNSVYPQICIQMALKVRYYKFYPKNHPVMEFLINFCRYYTMHFYSVHYVLKLFVYYAMFTILLLYYCLLGFCFYLMSSNRTLIYNFHKVDKDFLKLFLPVFMRICNQIDGYLLYMPCI